MLDVEAGAGYLSELPIKALRSQEALGAVPLIKVLCRCFRNGSRSYFHQPTAAAAFQSLGTLRLSPANSREPPPAPLPTTSTPDSQDYPTYPLPIALRTPPLLLPRSFYPTLLLTRGFTDCAHPSPSGATSPTSLKLANGAPSTTSGFIAALNLVINQGTISEEENRQAHNMVLLIDDSLN